MSHGDDEDDRPVGDDTLGRRLQEFFAKQRAVRVVRSTDPPEADHRSLRRAPVVAPWLGYALTLALASIAAIFAYGRAMERIDTMMSERMIMLTQMSSMAQRAADLGERMAYLEGAIKECRR